MCGIVGYVGQNQAALSFGHLCSLRLTLQLFQVLLQVPAIISSNKYGIGRPSLTPGQRKGDSDALPWT